MTWVWAVVAVWLVLGVLIGVLIGRGIRVADRKQAEALAAQTSEPNFVVDPVALPPDAHEPLPQQRVGSAEHMRTRGKTDRS